MGEARSGSNRLPGPRLVDLGEAIVERRGLSLGLTYGAQRFPGPLRRTVHEIRSRICVGLARDLQEAKSTTFQYS